MQDRVTAMLHPVSLVLQVVGGGTTMAAGFAAAGRFLCRFFRQLVNILPAKVFSELLAHFLHPSGHAARIILIQP
jgi:hypothetical protein